MIEKKRLGIFLDDERVVEDVTWIAYPANVEWYVVKRPEDFYFTVFNIIEERTTLDIISFDHDLQSFKKYEMNGEDKVIETTGLECFKFLLEACIKENYPLPQCLVHSKNIVGSKRLRDLISDVNKNYSLYKDAIKGGYKV